MASWPLAASATTSRSASWLMMLATPVLSQTNGHRPDEHVHVDAIAAPICGLRESTAAIRPLAEWRMRLVATPERLRCPDRATVTNVSDADADALGLSRMLVMPKLTDPRSPVMPRPSSAIDKRNPTPARLRRVPRSDAPARTALVRASCAMPMISRSTPASNAGNYLFWSLASFASSARAPARMPSRP